MKRKIIFLLPFLLILPSISLAHHKGKKVDAVTSATPVLIGQRLAIEVAGNFIDLRANLSQGGFPEWKGAKPTEPLIYYSTGGDPVGYCFSVIKGKGDLGYLLLSTDETRFPVQEFSRAPAPHQRSEESCKRIAQSLIKEAQTLGKSIFVYPPSAGVYFTLFPVYQGKKEVDRLIFCSRGLFLLPKEIMKLRSDLAPKKIAKEAAQNWELILNSDFHRDISVIK